MVSAQNITLPPTFGSTTLSAGFPDDPRSVMLTAGGTNNASTLTPATGSGACVGSIATAPDYSVTYNNAGAYPLIFSVISMADTTLVINGPNGQWYCNDDSNGLNPAVRFDTPASGRYDIFVGTYSSTPAPATLYISEIRVVVTP